MGRKAGQFVRCTCHICGTVELRTGCTTDFRCIECDPLRDNPTLQYLAHREVKRAVERGDLRSAREFSCVDCGVPAVEYDHRNYYQPLDVAPVCRRCNLRRGPAIGVKERLHSAQKAA